MNPNRRRQPGMGLMLLFYQLFAVIGIDKIPPVTLSVVGLQVAVFLRLFRLPWYKASHVCISAYNVWTRKEFSRLLYGALEHADDWHLYYNMLSFAYKGQSLERKLGRLKFLNLIVFFTVLTNAVLVALNIFASKYIPEFHDQCAIGFSGVIFALKVLTTYYDSNYTHHIMGIPLILPARYAVWAELIIIQLFVPNVSFFGHLAGILVGMAYVKGPLKFLLDTFYSMISSILSPSSSQPHHAGSTGYRPGRFEEFVPSGMSEEEQLRRAMEESNEELRRSTFQQNSSSYVPPYPSTSNHPVPPPAGFVFGDIPSSPPPPGIYPDIEEIRKKRETYYS